MFCETGTYENYLEFALLSLTLTPRQSEKRKKERKKEKCTSLKKWTTLNILMGRKYSSKNKETET